MKIIETNLNFKDLRKRATTKKIILHHPDAIKCTAQQIHEWHLNRGWSGAGYHFLIRKDGSIYRLRPEWAVGAHCKGHNTDSIGVCFEGDYENHDKSMPSKQLQAGIALINFLKSTYKLNKVYPHKELSTTNCPGKFFPLSKIIKDSSDLNYLDHLNKKDTIVQDVDLNQKILLDEEILFMEYTRALKLKSPQMYGEDVKQVQSKLNQLGFNCGIVDGYFGPKTDAAVRSFQYNNSLMVDGIVGPITWDKLFN